VSDAYDPSEEGVEAPEILTLPLDSWHRARGGRMVEFAGYHMPVQYEGILAEHLWTREHAGLFDVSHMGQVSVSVDEGELVAAEKALEALLPADLAALKLGRIRYSLLLNEDGGILDDLMVTRWADHFFLVVNGATKWDDLGHLRENLPDDITLSLLDEQALLALQGPEAALALASLGLEPVDGATAVEALSFMQAGRYLWQGRALGVSRSGYTGEDGYEISVSGEDAEGLAEALAAHPSVKPIGLGARDSLRLEAGLPLYGHDLNESTNPVSAGLSFAISKRRREEGGFPGAAKILTALAQGTQTVRVGLVLAGRQAAREGAQVYHGESVVGIVTSGGFAPSLGQPIAMADVSAGLGAVGTELFLDVRGKKLAATVTAMPFVPHTYFRSKKGAA
jgi:aminomethyltransferase